MHMHYRPLGKTGMEVSEIGYGAWGIGGSLWRGNDDRQSLAALRRAIELGVNFIDTALAYGDGHSEDLVGRVVRGSVQKIYVATKVPPKNYVWPAQPGVAISEVFPYGHIIRSTEESLRNLDVDVIDLQQLHVWNPEWIDRDEWRRAFEDLKQAGKVRFTGISLNDHQPDSALTVIRAGLVDTVQVIYNIFDQTAEAKLFPLARKHGIGVLARCPLDEGALTGAITTKSTFEKADFRAHYFAGDRKRKVVKHVDALVHDLDIEKTALPEMALRFCVSHPAVSTVIPGMRKVRHVESSCAVSDQGPLPARIRKILKKHAWKKNFYD